MTGSVISVAPAAASDVLEAGQATLIDVREDDEWAAGHAPGAVHIPLAALDPATVDGAQTVMVVCKAGGRSSKAATVLATAGLVVHDVTGGMTAWAAAGLPVVRDDGTAGTVG